MGLLHLRVVEENGDQPTPQRMAPKHSPAVQTPPTPLPPFAPPL